MLLAGLSYRIRYIYIYILIFVVGFLTTKNHNNKREEIQGPKDFCFNLERKLNRLE